MSFLWRRVRVDKLFCNRIPVNYTTSSIKPNHARACAVIDVLPMRYSVVHALIDRDERVQYGCMIVVQSATIMSVCRCLLPLPLLLLLAWRCYGC